MLQIEKKSSCNYIEYINNQSTIVGEGKEERRNWWAKTGSWLVSWRKIPKNGKINRRKRTVVASWISSAQPKKEFRPFPFLYHQFGHILAQLNPLSKIATIPRIIAIYTCDFSFFLTFRCLYVIIWIQWFNLHHVSVNYSSIVHYYLVDIDGECGG